MIPCWARTPTDHSTVLHPSRLRSCTNGALHAHLCVSRSPFPLPLSASRPSSSRNLFLPNETIFHFCAASAKRPARSISPAVGETALAGLSAVRSRTPWRGSERLCSPQALTHRTGSDGLRRPNAEHNRATPGATSACHLAPAPTRSCDRARPKLVKRWLGKGH